VIKKKNLTSNSTALFRLIPVVIVSIDSFGILEALRGNVWSGLSLGRKESHMDVFMKEEHVSSITADRSVI
jgi:hypothetical protein